jgi:putative transcriptional regulator
MKKNSARPLSKRLHEAMAELESAMKSGRRPEELFTIRTVEIIEPPAYSARKIRAMRNQLRVSQAVFAKLVGVSVQLVEHWEQGVCKPKALACRLLDEIDRDAQGFLHRHLTPSTSLRKTA